MKKGIHPNYVRATVRCACGNTFETGSTKEDLRVEICSKCHPFFSGQQKLVDTGGRREIQEEIWLKRCGVVEEG